MTFLAPLNLLWLGLLAPLIALYVLKRRREKKEVGSTLLWELALRDMRAEKPWKKLVPNVALLLQILAIVAGAIALARPAGAGSVPGGAWVAAVVDVSASMGAKDEEKTRIERAREVVRDLARGLPPGGRLMLLEAGRVPAVLAPPSDDRVVLERAIDELAVRGGSADLEGAVALAAERLESAPEGSRILLLTDAAQDGEVALDGRHAPVEVRRVGAEQPPANLAIVDADARPRLSEGPDRADLFARVANFGDRDAEVFVTAKVVGTEGVLASRRVTVPAGEVEGVVLGADLPPDEEGRAAVVELRLSRESGAMDDALALDDVAVVPSPGARRLPVFLVGSAPSAVERVLRADTDVELFATTLTALAEREEQAPLDGLPIYTGDVPDEAPPGDSVVIAPVGDRVFEVEVGEEVEAPRIVTWDEGDPRLRFVSMAEVHLASVRPLRGAAGRALVTTDRGPAMVSLSRPSGETTVIGFDPMRSDWPRQSSFVVFFRNLLEHARQRRAEGGVAPGALGEPLRVPAPDGAEVEVETPSGETRSALSRGGVAVLEVPAEPGVYRVSTPDGERHALRSLLDRSESDVRPRLTFTEGGAETETELARAEEHAESWSWVALLLLLVLAAEALWATRRARA